MALTSNRGGQTLHLCPHISLGRETKVDFSTPSLEPNFSPIAKGWTESIYSQSLVYGVENKLGREVSSTVWGMDASPLGDILVVAATFHPRNVPDYNIPSTARVALAISPAATWLGSLRLPEIRLQDSKGLPVV
jgi:hypothetical protein